MLARPITSNLARSLLGKALCVFPACRSLRLVPQPVHSTLGPVHSTLGPVNSTLRPVNSTLGPVISTPSIRQTSHLAANLERVGSDAALRNSLRVTLGLGLGAVGLLFAYGQWEVRRQTCVWDAWERVTSSAAVQERLGDQSQLRMASVLSGALRTDPVTGRRTAELSLGIRGPLAVATIHLTAHTEGHQQPQHQHQHQQPQSSLTDANGADKGGNTADEQRWILDNLSVTCPSTGEMIILLESGAPPQFALPDGFDPTQFQNQSSSPSPSTPQSQNQTSASNSTTQSPSISRSIESSADQFPLLGILLAAAIGTPLLAGGIYLFLKQRKAAAFAQMTRPLLERPTLRALVGGNPRVSGSFAGLWQPAEHRAPNGVASVSFHVEGDGSDLKADLKGKAQIQVHLQATQNGVGAPWSVHQATAVVGPYGRKVDLLAEDKQSKAQRN